MHDSTDQLRLVLALTLDASAWTSTDEPISSASTVITFSNEVAGIRCDGEISLRLTLAD